MKKLPIIILILIITNLSYGQELNGKWQLDQRELRDTANTIIKSWQWQFNFHKSGKFDGNYCSIGKIEKIKGLWKLNQSNDSLYIITDMAKNQYLLARICNPSACNIVARIANPRQRGL